MSLEAKIELLTAAVERMTAVLQSGALPVAAGTTPAAEPTAKGTRGKKPETPAAQPASTAGVTLNDGKSEMPNRLVDDPVGTRYFHIASHKTVAKVVPGEVIPTLAGMEEVTGTQYQNWKVSYAAPVPSSGAAPSGGAAAAPASSTPAASPASSPASAQPQPATTTAPTLDGPALTAKCQALHKAQGNPGLKQVLDKFAVTNVPGLVAKTAEYPLIAAFIDSLLNPQPAAETADANLFG